MQRAAIRRQVPRAMSLHDAVHLLGRVETPMAKMRRRHQHRIGVDGVAKPGDQPKLPHHGDQRAAHHQQALRKAGA